MRDLLISKKVKVGIVGSDAKVNRHEIYLACFLPLSYFLDTNFLYIHLFAVHAQAYFSWYPSGVRSVCHLGHPVLADSDASDRHWARSHRGCHRHGGNQVA